MSELIGELILMRWDALTIGGGGKQGETGETRGGLYNLSGCPQCAAQA